jgi:formiminoglutamase
MDAWDLLEAMFILGRHEKVKAIDVVGIDPLLDVRDATAKMGASIIATFLGGYVIRTTGRRGY